MPWKMKAFSVTCVSAVRFWGANCLADFHAKVSQRSSPTILENFFFGFLMDFSIVYTTREKMGMLFSAPRPDAEKEIWGLH
jgi:hypothetical protein